MPKGDTQKWKTAFGNYEQWDTPSARKVQEKEAKVIIEWLLELKLPKYNILEIGCGNGYVGNLIVSAFHKRKIPISYTFTDLIPECLEVAKKNTADLQSNADISFQILDVLEADKILGEESQDIIISTGYASAAGHPDAIPIISKILKKGAILISDFVNHLSPLLFMSRFPYSLFRFIKVIRGREEKLYHFGLFGIRDHFSKYKFRTMTHKTLRFRRNPLICMFKKI